MLNLSLKLVESSSDFSILALYKETNPLMLLPQKWKELVLELCPSFIRGS